MKKFRHVIPLLYLLLVAVIGWGQANKEKVNIKDFVSKTYIHGLPYKQVKSYGSEVLPVLEKLLYDPSYAKYKSNVVLCIGIIGKADGFSILKTYFYKHQGEMDYATFISLLVTLPSIGHVAQKGKQTELP